MHALALEFGDWRNGFFRGRHSLRKGRWRPRFTRNTRHCWIRLLPRTHAGMWAVRSISGGLACKLRVSGMIGDSIMMGIVNSAMEQAFDKAFMCKEGIIWRLNQKSRFCELAIMQLEWCLMFVQQEIENNNLPLFDDNDESSSPSCFQLHKKLISDLTDTRDRIQCHLRQTEMALWDKDRELSMETPPSHDNTVSGGGGGDDDGTADFCELKNSVDQQFFNIKQKLEDERVNFTKGGTEEEVEAGGAVNQDEEKEHYCDDRREDKSEGPKNQYLSSSAGFEKMRWDIDILKETFDVALGMMSKATSLAEVGPMERQWRWDVEKDTVALVFRGFLREIQYTRVDDSWWSSLMVEIASLRHQLHHLITQNEDDCVTTTPPTTSSKSMTSTSDVSSAQNSTGEEKVDKGEEQVHGSLVAEMIRNHESIIRQKSEELNWIKGEIVLRTGSAVNNKDIHKGRDATITMRNRIQHLISRLDIVLAQNLRRRPQHPHQQEDPDSDFGSDSDSDSDSMLIKTMIRHDIFVIIVKEWAKDLHSNLYNKGSTEEDILLNHKSIVDNELGCQLEAHIVHGNKFDNLETEIKSLRRLEDDVYMVFFREMVQELKEEQCIECSNRNQEEKSHISNTNNILPQLHILEEDAEDLRRQRKDALMVASSSSSSLLAMFTTFSEETVAFDTIIHDKIRLNVSRLEKLKSQIDFSLEHVTLTRKRELLYKNAFLRRCCNLQKAEVEVDLLADELEDLLRLLEKIYITLDHYSPVLQHYLGIEDILKLIREELNRPGGGIIPKVQNHVIQH